jgi:hypothetical protein
MSSVNKRWGWTEGAENAPSPIDASKLAFDSVTISDSLGNRLLTAGEFLLLPLDQRIRLNFQRRLRFYRGSSEVPAPEALRSMVAAARQAA